MFVLPPPSLSLGIIVPDLLGTNSSGPFSPTKKLPPLFTGPPLAFGKRFGKLPKPGRKLPKIVFTPNLIRVEDKSFNIFLAASPKDFVPCIAATILSLTPEAIVEVTFSKAVLISSAFCLNTSALC